MGGNAQFLAMERRCEQCGTQNRVPAKHLADRGRCGACKAVLSPLAVPLDANTLTFEDILANAKVPVLVDFWAPWCGPCRMVAPEVKKLAAEVAGKALVLKVNTDENPELGRRYAVSAIPSFAVFSGGRRLAQESGAMSQKQLLRLLARAA